MSRQALTLVRGLRPGSVPIDIVTRRRLLPFSLSGGVHAVAVNVVPPYEWSAALPPARAECVAIPAPLVNASARRLSTYLAGRHCAREALREAGCAPTDHLSMYCDGLPAWPSGIVGSIAHTDHVAIAAVAPSSDARGVGIDVERVLTATEAAEVCPEVAPELHHIAAASGGCDLSWADMVTVAFSAKESVYKCLAPITGTFFTFADVRIVRLDASTGRVDLRLVRHVGDEFGAGTPLIAQFRVADGLVLTMVRIAVASPARQRGPVIRAGERTPSGAVQLVSLY